MTDIVTLSRHWMRQTALGRGLRLDGDVVDLLNALGVGEMLNAEAAKVQKQQCLKRHARNRSIKGGNIASSGGQAALILKSSGMTEDEAASAALAQAQAMLSKRRRRSTATISPPPRAQTSAPHAAGISQTEAPL